jgi:acetolactate synthase-1/2/3 large subunit
MPTVAETIAATLTAHGIDRFFCVTGGDQPLWIALHAAGIKIVNCRSEASATYMADGYARVTGRPTFVYGQFGPGVANVAAALAEPYWANSPVVSLTSARAPTWQYLYGYQELDQLPMHEPVTRWNATLPAPDRTADLMRQAIRHAVGGRPGPVHLEVPTSMFSADAGTEPVIADEAFRSVPGPLPGPPPAAVSAIVDALSSARRPVLLAGTGALLSGAWKEVTALAERLNLPVATSAGGKGAIAENHRLSIGVVGRYARTVSNQLLADADLVVVLGSRLGTLVTDSGRLPPSSARIVHVDIDPHVFGVAPDTALRVVSDVRFALQAVLAEIERRRVPAGETDWAAHAQREISAWQDRVKQIDSTSQGGVHPAAVMAELRAALTPDDLVFADTGNMAAWASALYPVTAAGRTFHRAVGSLGWAFAAAMGGAMAAPNRRVACVIGDGGFGYHIGDIETALRHELPVIVVLLNNVSLAFEYQSQTHKYGGQVIDEANDFLDVNYAAVASAFGAHGQRITDQKELPGALADALAAGQPTILEIMTDKEALAPTTVFDGIAPRDI